ncbi:DUF4249 domain-containing protein [Capnocytophaga canis]|uniref:DUF4249 domain-containing protein n=1 Tax=Capnocytophaga canis TaxID=1848903 RepID=UPI0037D225B1
MKKYFSILLLLGGFLLMSCENFFKSEVDPPQISTHPQLVVHSYISAGSSDVKVKVALSNPIFGSRSESGMPSVSDARVTLRNDQYGSVTIPYETHSGYYIISTTNFPIEAGKTYYLEVQDTKGNKATAHCTVPHDIVGDVQNLKLINTKSEGSDAYQVSFDFQDTANQRNYYIPVILVRQELSNYDRRLEAKFFTDNNRDGHRITVRSEKEFGSAQYVKKVIVTLYNADVNFYEYARSVSSQNEAQDAGPFAETVILNSNIKGGLGVFGAYTKKVVTLEL